MGESVVVSCGSFVILVPCKVLKLMVLELRLVIVLFVCVFWSRMLCNTTAAVGSVSHSPGRAMDVAAFDHRVKVLVVPNSPVPSAPTFHAGSARVHVARDKCRSCLCA